MNDELVIEVLREVGMVDQAQIDHARGVAIEKSIPITDAFVELQWLAKQDILQAIAGYYGMEMVTLTNYKFDPEAVDSIPADVAKKYGIMPIKIAGDTLQVAVSDPSDISLVDTLRVLLHKNVEPVVAAQSEIDAAITQYYGSLAELGAIAKEDVDLDTRETGDREEATDDDAPVIRLVTKIIVDAHRRRASDIHLEPLEKSFRVRYRIDGVLQQVDNPHKRLQASIISRLKIMSKMSIAEKRIPQDGRIQLSVDGKQIDLRVSSVPTIHGESIVMRILDKSALMLGLPELGFLSDDQALFEKLISLPDGILLVTGPTGSGKTTTLYGCLNYINKPSVKIITVEDPVEYELAGINQVHVNEEIGMSFAAALRSMLRQAPNVIMVGEIRDVETANIAINASMTGHLVFSTLHTNDAPGAITRLIDIGVKPFLCASAIRAVMAQRLVRKICPKCKTPYTPTEQELQSLRIPQSQVAGASFMKGAGCENCNGSGYRGRAGIFEIFVINDEIRRMIYEKSTVGAVRQRARELGMRTLREDGMRKVLAGMTTPEEVLSITQGDKE
ncbi:ATPase, T2SS/T4P/T4SS family [Oscillatoria amoena NRMC-F 0135]|nr:ATPase, T2SS/T4P/T4SS family [Oscillatoria amoena NRMC-F 0135]MDL5055161.1 ATPase, T2SS/T4P/T4SS family [Oscillatoria laete-virens NRMC-F 0139]